MGLRVSICRIFSHPLADLDSSSFGPIIWATLLSKEAQIMNDKSVFSSATTMDPATSIANTNKVLSNTYWLLDSRWHLAR